MLPTNEKAGLGSIYKRIKDDEIGNIDEFDVIGKLFINKNPNVQKSNSKFEAQHLYILSDEEIKEKRLRWIIDNRENMNGFIHQVSVVLDSKLCPEIITTTDITLIHLVGYNNVEQSLHQIPQSFIEKYVSEYNKGNIITEVMVEYNDTTKNEFPAFGSPIWLKINPDNTITIKKVKDSWSREEVIKLIEKHTEDMFKQKITLNKWIEENL